MSAFNWDELVNEIEETTKETTGYEEDTRFYKLSKDKNGVGGALIRFVPSSDGKFFVKMTRINARKGANNRFCKDWSPISIGKSDPFNEKFLELWKEGKKTEAKKLGRQERYIANIKVLKDPTNPENEGKFFLLDMSKTLFTKLKDAIKPSEDEMAIDPDLKPKRVFDPVNGNNFLLKVKNGENEIPTYVDSKFSDKEDGIYDTDEEALKDIKKNAYPLKDWYTPEFYKSYDELKKCLNWFLGIDEVEKTEKVEDVTSETKTEPKVEKIEKVEETPEPKKVEKEEPKESILADDDLDSLLDDMDDI